MIYYKKKQLLSLAEIWYNYHELPAKKVDAFRYKFVTEDKIGASSYEELFTLLIDLTKEEGELFNRIKKNTRYEINRAQKKDGIACTVFYEYGDYNIDLIDKYINYYNRFAESKDRTKITRSDLEQFVDNKNLCVTCANSADESILTMHAYIVSDNTARLHHSSSLFHNSDDPEYRNLVARANRLLHWNDILYFKRVGLKWYDFGGWYGGEKTTGTYKEQLRINQFKESFGGEKKQEYSYIVPVTLLGKIAVFYRSLKKR
jgi:lipid II:glycine glycyltransferase (peptidoglycan interpeptide bridge formation enzyme)